MRLVFVRVSHQFVDQVEIEQVVLEAEEDEVFVFLDVSAAPESQQKLEDALDARGSVVLYRGGTTQTLFKHVSRFVFFGGIPKGYDVPNGIPVTVY